MFAGFYLGGREVKARVAPRFPNSRQLPASRALSGFLTGIVAGSRNDLSVSDAFHKAFLEVSNRLSLRLGLLPFDSRAGSPFVPAPPVTVPLGFSLCSFSWV